MAQKRVVSIEDRIPKLKKERRKKANRKLIFYLLIFFVLIFIVVYLQSPMSYVRHIPVSGTKWVQEEEVITLSEIGNTTNYWSVQTNKIKEKIEQHPQIEEAEVSKSFPNEIHINIDELSHTAFLDLEETLYPILENGDVLDKVDFSSVNGEVPLLRGFQDNHYLKELSAELAELSEYVTILISEIYWAPSETNPYKIKLYMTDGYEVESSIRNFSSAMESYPSIVAQLDNNKDGVLKIDESGAVFTPENVAASESDEEKEEENEE